jgi:protein O-mannosyl-transferase
MGAKDMTLRAGSKYFILAAIFLVALQFAVFGRSLDYAFLKYDDDVYVYENQDVQRLDAESIAWLFAKPYYRSYTPLPLLSHAIDFRLWGLAPWGHHLTSLILHCINSILLFFFVLQVLRITREPAGDAGKELPPRPVGEPDTAGPLGAFVAAAIFSLHPMRVESVAWVSDRKDLLLLLFMLPACMAYLRYDANRNTKRGLRWYLVSLVCVVLAAFSKSIAVVAPVLFLLFDAFLTRRHRSMTWNGLLTEKIPFFIVGGTFGAIAIVAAGGSRPNEIMNTFSTAEQVFLPFYSIMFYPVKMLWPSHLTPVYPPPAFPAMVLAAIVCIVITKFVIDLARRGKPLWLLVWLCYVVTVLPTVSAVTAGIQLWADRYSYVAAVGLVLPFGVAVRDLWHGFGRHGVIERGSIVLLSSGLIAVCCALSVLQLPVWQNGESLWQHAISEAPDLARPYGNLGVVLENEGDHSGALAQYRRAIALEPGYADALYNMGIAYESMNFQDSAALSYSRAIAMDSSYDDAYVNLGNLCVASGKLDEAIMLFERAIAINGSDPDPYYNMGIALYTKGDAGKALESFQEALKRSPGYAKAYHNMGAIYLHFGLNDAAFDCFKRAARLGLTESQNLLRSRGQSW